MLTRPCCPGLGILCFPGLPGYSPTKQVAQTTLEPRDLRSSCSSFRPASTSFLSFPASCLYVLTMVGFLETAGEDTTLAGEGCRRLSSVHSTFPSACPPSAQDQHWAFRKEVHCGYGREAKLIPQGGKRSSQPQFPGAAGAMQTCTGNRNGA